MEYLLAKNLNKLIGHKNIAICLLFATFLASCSKENTDLNDYLDKFKIQPLPKKINLPEISNTSHIESIKNINRDPFHINLEDKSAGLSKKVINQKTYLESVSVDKFLMVGLLSGNGAMFAVVKSENLLFLVKNGSKIGLNNGKVTQMDSQKIEITEIVTNSIGLPHEQKKVLLLNSVVEK